MRRPEAPGLRHTRAPLRKFDRKKGRSPRPRSKRRMSLVQSVDGSTWARWTSEISQLAQEHADSSDASRLLRPRGKRECRPGVTAERTMRTRGSGSLGGAMPGCDGPGGDVAAGEAAELEVPLQIPLQWPARPEETRAERVPGLAALALIELRSLVPVTDVEEVEPGAGAELWQRPRPVERPHLARTIGAVVERMQVVLDGPDKEGVEPPIAALPPSKPAVEGAQDVGSVAGRDQALAAVLNPGRELARENPKRDVLRRRGASGGGERAPRSGLRRARDLHGLGRDRDLGRRVRPGAAPRVPAGRPHHDPGAKQCALHDARGRADG